MQILTIARISFREFLRRRVVYGLFLIGVLFIFFSRGCSPGTLQGEGVFFERQTVQQLEVVFAFHLIALCSMLLCAFVAAAALTREFEDGTAFLTLSRPLRRAQFVAGKLLAVTGLCGLNLLVLGLVFCGLYYARAGMFAFKVFPALALMLPGMLFFALLCMLFSLVLPRLIVPILAVMVYAVGMWNTLPFYSSTVRMVWAPSGAVERMYRYFPQFGELQFIAASLIGDQSALGSVMRPLVFVLLYGFCLWLLTVFAVSRKQF